jgi:hypothetical protein
VGKVMQEDGERKYTVGCERNGYQDVKSSK